jgi:hypothetical protein
MSGAWVKIAAVEEGIMPFGLQRDQKAEALDLITFR